MGAAKKDRKRFIAGATCPKCGAEDRIFLMGEGSETTRGCNACDFSERLSEVANPDVTEAESTSADDTVRIKMPD